MSTKKTPIQILEELKELRIYYEDLCNTFNMHKDNLVLCKGVKTNLDKVKSQMMEHEYALKHQYVTVVRVY